RVDADGMLERSKHLPLVIVSHRREVGQDVANELLIHALLGRTEQKSDLVTQGVGPILRIDALQPLVSPDAKRVLGWALELALHQAPDQVAIRDPAIPERLRREEIREARAIDQRLRARIQENSHDACLRGLGVREQARLRLPARAILAV